MAYLNIILCPWELVTLKRFFLAINAVGIEVSFYGVGFSVENTQNGWSLTPEPSTHSLRSPTVIYSQESL